MVSSTTQNSSEVEITKSMEVDRRSNYSANNSTKDGSCSPSSRASSPRDEASLTPMPTHSTATPTLGGVQVTVKNTFLHLKDDDNDDDTPKPLRRSISTGALMSSCAIDLELFVPTAKVTSQPSASLASNSDAESPSRFSPRDELSQAEEVSMEAGEEQADDAINMTRKVPHEVMKLAHDMGQCKPCIYFAFKEDKCRNMADCAFCHFCTKKEILARRKRMKAVRRAASDSDPQGAPRQGKANPPMKPGEVPRAVGLQNPSGLTTLPGPVSSIPNGN
mmetsp:Transcript_116562/g.250446  ORF Transcript_116562/g.250446 Transcript_116562/m.250446 type:complete len:277 (+) Transcript_116562:91-921(+)